MIVPSRPFPEICFSASLSGAGLHPSLERMTFYSYGRVALLHGMLRLGLKPGDAIAIPAYYCESALQSIVAYGFKPVFIDVGDDLQLPLDAVETVFSTQKIKAVLLTHFFGFVPAARGEIISLCWAADVKVIEDCSHSFLSYLYSKNTRQEADAYVFSLRKILPIADGGALLAGKCQGDTVSLQPASGPLLNDLPFLLMRTIEAAVIKFGWPNLYSPQIGKLRAALSRSDNNAEKAAMYEGLQDNLLPPSYNLAMYLRNEPCLRRIAQSRVLNYRQLVQAIAPSGIEAIVPDISDGEIPQVLPVLDATGTLVNYLRTRGIGAYHWPGEEMPIEVTALPSLYPNAIRLNESIACFPIHQDISDKHIVFMADAVADWKNTCPVESAWR